MRVSFSLNLIHTTIVTTFDVLLAVRPFLVRASTATLTTMLLYVILVPGASLMLSGPLHTAILHLHLCITAVSDLLAYYSATCSRTTSYPCLCSL